MRRITRILKFNSGYTLVELLTVIVVVVVVGMIVATILVSSLRGSNKTTVINDVRDNGNTAITQISRAVEFAKSFEGVSTGEDSDGNVTYSDNCLSTTITPTPVPNEYKFIKIRTFEEQEIVFYCPYLEDIGTIATNDATLSQPPTPLVDSSMTVSNCYFSCSQSYISQPPTIGINFTLTKGASSLFSEQKFPLDFHTTVVMRNLGE